MNLHSTKSSIFLKKIFRISKPIYLLIVSFNFLLFNINTLHSKELVNKYEGDYKTTQNLKVALEDIEKLLIKNNQELLNFSKLIFLFSIKSKLLSFTIAPAAFVGPSLPSVPADNKVNLRFGQKFLIFFIKCKANS